MGLEEDKTFQKLRENERETRKNLILDAALSLFEKKTFYKTSMNDIAKEVGVSTATLYSYFSSQEGLFLEAFIRDLSHIDQIMKAGVENAVLENNQTAMDALGDTIVSHLMNSEATFQMISLLITERNMPEPLLEKFAHMRRELNERIKTVLTLSGVKNPDETTSRAFFVSVLGAILLFRNYPEKNADPMENPEEIVKELVRYIVNIFKAGIPVMKSKRH